MSRRMRHADYGEELHVEVEIAELSSLLTFFDVEASPVFLGKDRS
jgi:hypothetical protein